MNLKKPLKNPSMKAHAQGFTLLELIMVLVLIIVLMAWGIPNYQDLKARRLVTDFSNEMVYSLTLARAEAVRYGTTVTVSPVSGWQDGWTITAANIDGNDNVVLAMQEAVDEHLTLTQIGNLSGDLVFNSVGGLNGTFEGRFELVNNHVPEAKRTININMSGSAKVIRQ